MRKKIFTAEQQAKRCRASARRIRATGLAVSSAGMLILIASVLTLHSSVPGATGMVCILGLVVLTIGAGILDRAYDWRQSARYWDTMARLDKLN